MKAKIPTTDDILTAIDGALNSRAVDDPGITILEYMTRHPELGYEAARRRLWRGVAKGTLIAGSAVRKTLGGGVRATTVYRPAKG